MANAYWLLKSEPEKYSWDDLVRDGSTVWDGVRNNQAALYLKAMKTGDEALIYHSQSDKAVVGRARVTDQAFIDPSDPAGRFVAVKIAPIAPLKRPVSLAELRAELPQMLIFRQFRLSVTPLISDERDRIVKLGGG